MADALSASIFIGETVSGGTSGSILYIDANGKAAQNNASLFWDNVNLAITVHNAKIHTSGDSSNFFAGNASGNFTNTAINCVGIGGSALSALSNGQNNTCVGWSSGANLTSGINTTAIGKGACFAGISISSTVAVGVSALSNCLVDGNTAIGVSALQACNSLNNVAIGYQAGTSITSSPGNTIAGYQAAANQTSGSGNNCVFGYGALNGNVTGAALCAFGVNALFLSTDGGSCAFGYTALQNSTAPNGAVAVGYQALLSTTTGSQSTAVGYQAGNFGTTNALCSFFGFQATSDANGLSYACAIGAGAVVHTSNTMILGGTGSAAVKVGINQLTAAVRLDILDTSGAQLRLAQAAGSAITDFQTDSSGNLTITPSGGTGKITGGNTYWIINRGATTNDGNTRYQTGGADDWVTGVSATFVSPTSDYFIGYLSGSWKQVIQASKTNSVILNNAAIATAATDGFLYVAGMAGIPTGTPTAFSGRYPFTWNSTDKVAELYDTFWRSISPIYAYKSSDQTITNSTTLTDDTALTVNVKASRTYRFRFVIFETSASATAGIKLTVNGTCTATAIKFQAIDFAGTPLLGRGTSLGASVGLGIGTGDNFLEIEGTIQVNAAGTLKLQWAQNVADAVNGTTVQQNSYVELVQIG